MTPTNPSRSAMEAARNVLEFVRFKNDSVKDAIAEREMAIDQIAQAIDAHALSRTRALEEEVARLKAELDSAEGALSMLPKERKCLRCGAGREWLQ